MGGFLGNSHSRWNELKAHAIIVIKLRRKLSGNCAARSLFAEATQDHVCVGERG